MCLAIAGYLPDIPLPEAPRSAPRELGGRPGLDLKGRRYGSLRVLGRSGKTDSHGPRWRCKCRRCGAIVEVRSDHLRDRSRPRTCGCAPQSRRVWRWWLE